MMEDEIKRLKETLSALSSPSARDVYGLSWNSRVDRVLKKIERLEKEGE